MVACEFVDPATGQPDAERARRAASCIDPWPAAADLRCIWQRDSLLFPLTVPDAVFDEALAIWTGR